MVAEAVVEKLDRNKNEKGIGSETVPNTAAAHPALFSVIPTETKLLSQLSGTVATHHHAEYSIWATREG